MHAAQSITIATMKVGKYRPTGCDELVGLQVVVMRSEFLCSDLGSFDQHEGNWCDMRMTHSSTNQSSASSMLSIHPAYLRHKDLVLRSQRGRSTGPAQRLPQSEGREVHDDGAQANDQDASYLGDRVDIVKIGHMILAASDVVEVMIDDASDRKFFPADSYVSSADLSCIDDPALRRRDADYPYSAQAKNQKEARTSRRGAASRSLVVVPTNYKGGELCDRLKINTSPSSAFSLVDPTLSNRYNTPRKMAGNGSKSEPLMLTPFNSSQKPNTARPRKPPLTPVVKGFRVLKSRIKKRVQNFLDSPINGSLGSVCESQITGPTSKKVAFQEPAHVIIPLKRLHSLATGDIVDILDGPHKNKIGRVIKKTAELYQVGVGRGFVLPFYLSPSMLRLRLEPPIILIED